MSRKRLGLRIALVVSALAAVLPVTLGGSTASAENGAMWFPITGRVISDYGDPRDGTRRCPQGEHCGYDIDGDNNNSSGTPVYAAFDGTVGVADSGPACTAEASYGNIVYLNHPSGWQTRYAHLQSFSVSAGQHVTRGQQIGVEGNTGNACLGRVHLHFEILRNGVHQDLSKNGVMQNCTQESAICAGMNVVAKNPINYDFAGLSGYPYSPYYRDMSRSVTGNGYWIIGSDGGVFAYGDAPFKGSLPALGIGVNNIVGIAPTTSGQGYWLAGNDGGVFALGDAPYQGNALGTNNIVAIAARPAGGYWLLGSDGGVFAFGGAPYLGNALGQNTFIDIVSTKTGQGYYLVGKDGGVYAFGDAVFSGRVTGRNDIVGMALAGSGVGYYIVAANGAVFTFGGAPFLGDASTLPLVAPIVGIDSRPTGAGYWLNGGDGGVFAFGDAPFLGRPQQRV